MNREGRASTKRCLCNRRGREKKEEMLSGLVATENIAEESAKRSKRVAVGRETIGEKSAKRSKRKEKRAMRNTTTAYCTSIANTDAGRGEGGLRCAQQNTVDENETERALRHTCERDIRV